MSVLSWRSIEQLHNDVTTRTSNQPSTPILSQYINVIDVRKNIEMTATLTLHLNRALKLPYKIGQSQQSTTYNKPLKTQHAIT